MPPIARLVCNRNGWTTPSGTDCKFQDNHGFLHEAIYGFGFEEWLFRGFNFTDENQEKWYLGYLQGIDNQADGYEANHLFLSTNLYPNQNAICPQHTKRIVGKLNLCKKLTIHEKEIAHNILFDINQVQQFPNLLRNELENGLLHDVRLQQALNSFDDHLANNNLFNVKFNSAQRFNLPNENINWNYLQWPHGIIHHIPDNFQLAHIANDQINDYLAMNGGFIQQVLPAL